MRDNAAHHGSNRWRRALGLVFCVLLCFFAVAAKSGVYKPVEQQVRALTSAKVWRGNLPTTAVTDQAHRPAAQTATLAAFALLLLLTTLSFTGELRNEQPVLVRSRRFSPAVSVRPPPSK